MVIDILKVGKQVELNLGDVIVARHKVRTDKMLYYKLIEEGRDGVYRLLNLGTNRIMATFSSKNPTDAFVYVEIAVKAEILDIVPSSKLKLTTVSVQDI